MSANKDWRKTVGFPINYESSEDETDSTEVVMRHPVTSSRYLLEDRGDGAEADILGSTPPREQRRGKRGKKSYMEMICSRRSTDGSPITQQAPSLGSDYVKKHLERKWSRLRERDRKTDLGIGEHRTESLPGNVPAVPTLVESCNRFMCLTSRLKQADARQGEAGEEPRPRRAPPPAPAHDRVTASRVDFHNTFSMLINMGNVDKGCRRTISREEQVWQNELKDLIWLELQAKIAGRSLARQDAFLCAQRRVAPTVLANITNYRFVNPNPCTYRSRRRSRKGSADDLTDGPETKDSGNETDTDDEALLGCLSLSCAQCSDAVGKALREVGTLLDSYHNALALYPSSNAMTQEHPLVATSLFNNRIKAMCLWYNSAVYMRLKMLAVRRMLRTARQKQRRGLRHLASTDSDQSRQSPEVRPCTVRFNVSNTPTDSNTSDSSAHSDLNPETKDLEDPKGPTEDPKRPTEDPKGPTETPKEPTEDPKTLTEDTRGPTEDPKNRSEEAKETEHVEKDGKDDVDSGKGSEKRYSLADTTAPTTPEIVIDSKYGTVDSMTSQSSGYTSNTESDVSGQEDDLYDMGSLEDLTRLQLLGKCKVSVYREPHREMLKTQGVRRCLMFMNKLRKSVLGKVYLTLEKLDSVKRETSEEYNEDDPVEVFNDTKEEEEKTPGAEGDDSLRAYEMRRYGCWSEECLAMRLPSYRNHFLLLSSICMEAVHDYLTLRLEDQPQNPSCLTVKQLIHELKEGLDIAAEMRAAFVRNIAVALAGHRAGAVARHELLVLVHTYDATVETALSQYLSYLRKISEVEHMARWSLQAEWTFTARLARRVKCVALRAPAAFSEIACNQLNRSVNRFKQKFKELSEKEAGLEDANEYMIYMLCRETQQIYSCEREAALQAAVWARALAGRLLRAPQPYCKQRADIINSLMALRDVIAEQTEYILARSDAPTDDVTKDVDTVMGRVRELLLQVYRLGFELHKELYQFAQAPYKLYERRTQRPASLQPVRPRAEYRRRRPETMLVNEIHNPMVHKELHRLINSSRPQMGSQRRSMQSSPPKCRLKLMRSESIGEDGDGNALDDKLFEGTADGPTHSSIERILSGDLPLIEEVELRSSNSGSAESAPTCDEEQWAKRVARAIVEFARCWMTFVLKRCDTGRGRRPRWASQGLEFLMLACDPCNTKYLTDEEFEELKKEMDGCISHVIGSRPVAPRTPDSGQSTPVPGRRRPIHTSISSTTSPYLANSTSVNAGEPITGTAAESAGGNEDGVPTPPTPPTEPDPLLSFHTQTHQAHSRRVLAAIKELDARRDATLRERKALGRVVEAAAAAAGPKLRHVQFKWQRGLKIGAGTFGKVYTVVTESGQLLAMKELSIGAGDRRALQRAANELRVLEGVIHPHLVRYYGCEVHREEMLIFMELCVEGSLEALIATAGALAEGTIRRYTKQLVSAVQELHHRSIVHRDIKSGNIFLTNEGHCLKLGDFGSAVKIRATTTAVGELQGCVGTQAYMAPEVFMKSSGHGRAADIWSLGCVVTEMASGKRPWPQYDSNYQIMFVVGMGGRPEIPPTLSEEGKEFCLRCLTHEPEKRARIAELAMHHFLMVKSDDDCECQPASLIT